MSFEPFARVDADSISHFRYEIEHKRSPLPSGRPTKKKLDRKNMRTPVLIVVAVLVHMLSAKKSPKRHTARRRATPARYSGDNGNAKNNGADDIIGDAFAEEEAAAAARAANRAAMRLGAAARAKRLRVPKKKSDQA